MTNHSGELLNQVNVIKDLETMLCDVHKGVEHLESSVGQYVLIFFFFLILFLLKKIFLLKN